VCRGRIFLSIGGERDNRRGGKILYWFILPGFTLGNLGLGLFLLTMLRPPVWLAGLELVAGALCCCVAGWLGGAAWTKSIWGSAMERQVRTWRRIVDAMFGWIEEAPVPADSIHTLKRSLDKAILDGALAPRQLAPRKSVDPGLGARRRRRSCRKVVERIHRHAVQPHLEVHVWPGGVAGRTLQPDDFALLYLVSGLDQDLVQVPIERGDAVRVPEHHVVPVAAAACRSTDDLAVIGGQHRVVLGARDVQACMEVGESAEGRLERQLAGAEALRDLAFRHRPDEPRLRRMGGGT